MLLVLFIHVMHSTAQHSTFETENAYTTITRTYNAEYSSTISADHHQFTHKGVSQDYFTPTNTVA